MIDNFENKEYNIFSQSFSLTKYEIVITIRVLNRYKL